VGDHDQRHAVRGQAAHHVEDLPDELGVQRTGGLVEQHQLGLHRQRAGDRDALLLTARQLRRVGVDLVRQPDSVQQLSAPVDGLALAQSAHLHRGLDDVAEGRHVREEVEALEDHADVGARRRGLLLPQLVELLAVLAVADELAVNRQPATVDLLEVVDAPQEGRLAGAGRAEQATDLARLHGQVDAPQDLELAEVLVHGFGQNHGSRHRVPILRSFWIGVRARLRDAPREKRRSR
jgi:hypothetical protein